MLGKEKHQQSFTDYMINNSQSIQHRETFLTKIDKIIDWKPIERILETLFTSHTGRPSIPPLVTFKMLLLQQFYNFSDPELEYATYDRLSFRRFAGLGMEESVPDETTMVRFRKRLIEAKVYDELLEIVNIQLESKNIMVKKAAIIDATLVESASAKPRKGCESKDSDASWTSKRGKAHYGYKAHISVDTEHHLIENAELTTASVHDSKMFEAVLPEESIEVYADKGYASQARKRRLQKQGIHCGIMDKGARNRNLTPEEKKSNKVKSRIRANVERVFAHLKQWFGYTRVRYIGLSKNRLQLKLLAIAYNLKRSAAILMG